jgi:L-seryl-tRNA(Ser) seleniumtransferase
MVDEQGNGKNELQALLRQLPSVDRLLLSPVAYDLVDNYGRSLVLEALRTTLDEVRAAIIGAGRPVPMNATIVQEAREWLEALLAPTLRPVINATGVIIHTNLGRAPLSQAAMAAISAVAGGYASLEYDLPTGVRGTRSVHAAQQLTRITGAEDALVVNNNAGAVLLMLTGLCQGREVIISRGQLVEIGGGFRVPDVMAQSGARLVEVGTTNRTHLRDYARAIGDQTAAILVAHHSNFKIVGFTAEPELAELAELAHEHHLPLLYDQGSGALRDTSQYGLAAEPTVLEGLAAGSDLVTFSGDKLLGGPQAGILCGHHELIEQLRRHPLARALRPDKLCLSALSATLTHYLTGKAETAIPVWQMIARPLDEIAETADAWAERLRSQGVDAEVLAGESTVGGGSLPGATLPTRLLALSHPNLPAVTAALRLEHDPPVIARIADDRLLLDPRTVLDGQAEELLVALARYAKVPLP